MKYLLILAFSVALIIGQVVFTGNIRITGNSDVSAETPPPPPPPSDSVLAFDGSLLDALANGANVSSVNDAFNSSNIWRAPSTNPTKQTTEGYSVVRSIAAAQRLVSSNLLDATFNTNFTIVSVTRALTNQVNQYYASHNGTGFGFAESQVGGTRANSWFGVSGAAFTPSYGQVCSFAYDGANVRMMRNKRLLTSPAKTGDLNLNGALTIGALSTAASPLFGDIRRLYVYNRVLSTNEINTIADYAYYYDAGFAGFDTYLFVGDSQTTTTGGTITYVDVMRTNFNNGGAVYNYIQTFAGASWTTTTALTNTADLNWVGLPNLARTNVAIMWIGTNNDNGVATAPQIVSGVSELALKYKTNNCLVVWLTMLPKVGNDDSVRQAVNATIRANPTVYNIDKISPIEDDPRLQDPTDTTYFADGLHLTNAGKIIVADITYPVVFPW